MGAAGACFVIPWEVWRRLSIKSIFFLCPAKGVDFYFISFLAHGAIVKENWSRHQSVGPFTIHVIIWSGNAFFTAAVYCLVYIHYPFSLSMCRLSAANSSSLAHARTHSQFNGLCECFPGLSSASTNASIFLLTLYSLLHRHFLQQPLRLRGFCVE